jgi:hypothetical protein
MAFTDILGRVVENRMQGVADRYNQATNLLSGDPDAWAAQFGLETEEEKRRRREREQQQQDLANVVTTSTKVDTYGDGSQTETVKREIPAAVAPEDIVPAQEPVDMGMMQQQQEPAPAQVQTAPTAPAAPQAMAQPQPVLNPQLTPEQQAQAAQIEALAAQQAGAAPAQAPAQTQPMSMAQQAAAGLPQAQPQPQAQPVAQQAAPIAPNQAVPDIGAPPVPGPGVQVAAAPGAAMPTPPPAAPAPAAAPAAAPAPAEPAWIKAANEAGNDFDRLVEVAAQFPEARGSLKEKMRAALDNQRKSEEAQKIVLDAAQGDPKAQNKLQQALRPERGRAKEEVTTSDYVKAYLYARLGLNELAAEAQKKIVGKQTKFGQMQLGNSIWETETDSQGRIVGARDDEGNVATESTLNKLRASGQKFGTQSFSATGGSQVIPKGQADAGEEYRTVFDSRSGSFVNTIITGPNAGKPYTGPAGVDKSVFTQGAKMDYGVISKYRERFGTDKLAALDQARKDGAVKSPKDELDFLDRWNFVGGVPGYGAPGEPTISPQSSVATPVDPAAQARAQRDVESLNKEIARVPANDPKRAQRLQILNDELAKAQRAAGGPAPAVQQPPAAAGAMPTGAGGVPVRGTTESETEFNQRKAEFTKRQDLERQIEEERRKAIQKPAAEQIAASADTQNMLKSIDKVVKTLDSGKHNIGSALSVVAGRGPIAQAIGGQFETTDAKNTKLILDTVTKLAAEGLKILGSNPSGPDLQFWTANKPDGSSDPEFMKEWVQSRSADLKRRLQFAEQQVGTGGRAGTAPAVFPEKTIDGTTYIYDGKGWKKK